jgi:glutaredoxin
VFPNRNILPKYLTNCLFVPEREYSILQGVNVYTIIGRPDCHWCEKAKKLLTEKGREYQYIDLIENIWVAAIMMKGGYRKVPLIIQHTEVIGGYLELEEKFKELVDG